MTERLTDERVAARTTIQGNDLIGIEIQSLAREVQDWRRLVNGGPCPLDTNGDGDCHICAFRPINAPNGCVNGHTPGLAGRLENVRRWLSEAALALAAARTIGERHGTPLNFGNIDRLIESNAVPVLDGVLGDLRDVAP